MAAGAETRERPGARSATNTQPSSEDVLGSLLMDGIGDGGDVGGGESDTGSEDELEPGADFEDDEEEDDEEDDGAGESDEESDEDAEELEPGAEETPAARAKAEVDGWATKVLAKPGRISQVPSNRRAAVVTRFGELRETAGLERMRAAALQAIPIAEEQAYQRGLSEGRAAVQGDTEFEEVAYLAENDVEGFGQLGIEDPAKMRRYLDRLEAKTKQPTQDAQMEAIKASANAVLEKVRGNAAVLAKLEAKKAAAPGRYEFANGGLANLAVDVAEALAETQAEAARKAKEPVRKLAADRENGARHRETLPRVAGGEGRGGTTSADLGSPDEWLTQGFIAAAENRRKGK